MAAASNLVMRFATAGVAVPIILSLIYIAPPWGFSLLVLGAAIVGAWELFAMTHPGDRISQGVGVLVTAVTLARLGSIDTAALRAGALGFGPLFIGVPLTLMALMRVNLGAAGSGSVILALGLAWFADTGAYFAGRFLGKHKLYQAVSPKKTVEGAIGGLVASVVWALLGCFFFLRSLPVAHAIPLALVAGVLGQSGDLAESLLKRSTGVKDSGAIVPGHGGILDRVDALLVTSTVVYLYGVWMG